MPLGHTVIWVLPNCWCRDYLSNNCQVISLFYCWVNNIHCRVVPFLLTIQSNPSPQNGTAAINFAAYVVWSSKISLKSVKFTKFIVLTNCMHHFHSNILQKTPLKLVNWFQRYEQLKDAKNNRKRKTFSALFGSILKSIFQSSNWFCLIISHIYRLITAYLLLRVNLDKKMHAHWDFDASSARTWKVSALDKHQNWSASALFCLNSRAQSKYAVVNLIHTRRKQTFLSFIMW